MYLKKNLYQELVKKSKNIVLDEVTDNPVPITSLLNEQQIHQIIARIVNDIPENDLERVIRFHNTFKIPREESDSVTEYKYSELRFRLIAEEAIELAAALGFSKDDTYRLLLELLSKVYDSNPVQSKMGVLDALLDLIYVTYGSFDIFNMSEIAEEGMAEVQSSNMSKVLPDVISIEVIKATIADLKNKGFNPVTVDLKNGYIQFRDRDTGKVLKPLGYKKPNLEKIIQK